MLVANAAITLCAWLFIRSRGTSHNHLDVPLVLLLRLALISATVLVAGVTGTLRQEWIGCAGACVLALSLWHAVRKKRISFKLPQWGILWYCCAGVFLLRAMLHVWLLAPANPDALSYHLTKVAEWVQSGGFTRELGVDTHAPFPAGFELVEAWWSVFLHHDVLIEIAGAEFLLLTVSAAFGIAKEAGFTERQSAWATLAVASIPGFSLSLTSCLNDGPIAALVVVTMLLVISRAPWPWIVLAAGMGVGIKPTYAYAGPGFLVLAWMCRKEVGVEKRAFVLPCALGILLGVFWYLRNVYWFGNPIFPVGRSGLLASSGELKIQFGPSVTSWWKNTWDLLGNRVLDDHVAYSGLFYNISGWGCVAFAVGGIGVLLWCREASLAKRLLAAFTMSLCSVLLLVNHDVWYARFVLFFPVALILGAVWLAARHKPILILLVLGGTYQFLSTCFTLEYPADRVRALCGMSWKERSVARIVGLTIPEEATIIFRIVEPIHNRGESYLLYGPGFTRNVRYFRGNTLSELRELAQSSGAKYIYSSIANPKHDELLEDGIRQGLLARRSERLCELTVR